MHEPLQSTGRADEMYRRNCTHSLSLLAYDVFGKKRKLSPFPPTMKLRENPRKTCTLSTQKAWKCFASYRQIPTKNNWIVK